MVKIVPIIVAQATYALVIPRICVTTGNGNRVSFTAEVRFTKLSYGHGTHLDTLTQPPTHLGPENYTRN